MQVSQAQAGGRQGEQRRATAGDDREHQVALSGSAEKVCHTLRAPHPGLVGQRVSRLNHIDRPSVQSGIGIASLGDDQTTMDPVTQALVECGSHGCGGFSATDNPDPLDASKVVVTLANGQ